MLVYIYDGSFEGLLTAIYEAYYRRETPQRFLTDENLQLSLVDSYVHIATDTVKSDKVYRSIIEKISREALENAYHVFLSNEEERGTIIYEYLKLGWKLGSRVDLCLSDDRVLKVHKIARRIKLEVHRMMGFVRFKAVEGCIYYARIEPDNNILELLAPHFAERFSGHAWIIHDIKRNIAAVYDTKDWVVARDVEEVFPKVTGDELAYRALWKEFFRTAAIQSRINPRLQRRLMPARYWKHITEME